MVGMDKISFSDKPYVIFKKIQNDWNFLYYYFWYYIYL
jgi:hypothetical protein